MPREWGVEGGNGSSQVHCGEVWEDFSHFKAAGRFDFAAKDFRVITVSTYNRKKNHNNGQIIRQRHLFS